VQLPTAGRRVPSRPAIAAALVALLIAGIGLTSCAFQHGGGSRAVVASTASASTASGLGPAVPPSTGLPASPGAAASSGTPSPAGTGHRATAPIPPAAGARKKGVSLWSSFGGASQALSDVRASWFYNWSPQRGTVTAPSGVEFVPMIWGAASANAATIAKAKAQGKVLLGFNEPDLGGQSNMTVQQALDLWPRLMSTGMRLGSPAPASGADRAGSWFDQFMSGVKARGYRVDFITLHWYGSDFSAAAVNQLKSYLQATYNRYHLPIWLTEYALIRFSGSPKFPTQDQQAQFARSSIAMMEGLSYVERYAWFSLPSSKSSDTGLYTNGTTPTQVGAAYRDAGNG
jgi:hypothetical protein